MPIYIYIYIYILHNQHDFYLPFTNLGMSYNNCMVNKSMSRLILSIEPTFLQKHVYIVWGYLLSIKKKNQWLLSEHPFSFPLLFLKHTVIQHRFPNFPDLCSPMSPVDCALSYWNVGQVSWGYLSKLWCFAVRLYGGHSQLDCCSKELAHVFVMVPLCLFLTKYI